MTSTVRRNNLKRYARTAIWAAILLVVALAALFPVLLRIMGFFGCSLSEEIRLGLEDAELLNDAAKTYRRAHDGRNPATFDELRELVMLPPDAWTPRSPLLADSDAVHYYPKANNEDLVVYRTTDARTVIWITRDGRVFFARDNVFGLRWPKYERKSGS